jgi:hypothetical protein
MRIAPNSSDHAGRLAGTTGCGHVWPMKQDEEILGHQEKH